MSDLCQKIESAKACVSEFGEAYVKASTFGNNNDDMFYELILLHAYIEALERYDCGCKHEKCLTEEEVCSILNQIALKCESFKCGC